MDKRSAIKTVVTPVTKPKEPSKQPTRNQAPPKRTSTLPIPEELFILTIDDNDGVISAPMQPILRYGLAGAFLAELMLKNKIQVAEDRLVLASSTPSNDALFDDIMALIAAENRPRKQAHWVEAIGSKLTIKRVGMRLVERNVIANEKKHYSWIIPYPAFPKVEASAKYWVKQHLRGIVLAGESANSADIILLSLLKGCSLLRLVFTRDERKYADKKVDTLVQGEVFGEAVAKVLAEK